MSLNIVFALPLAFALTLGLVLSVVFLRQTRTQAPLPPGPKGLPFIGNVFDVPARSQWITYERWAREFNSPIIYLNFLGQHVVILNDIQSAKDILDLKAANFNGRPRMPMLNEAIEFNWNFAFSTDLALWKACRHAFEPRFRQALVKNFHPQMRTMSFKLLGRLLATPDDFARHLRYMTGSFILDIIYGIDVKPEGDEYIGYAEKGQEGVDRSGDQNILDIIPWIRHVPSWIPGMGWMKEVKEWREGCFAMRDATFEFVQQQLRKGYAKPCLTTDLLDSLEVTPNDAQWRERIIKCTAGTTYSAGSDSTVSALHGLILALLVHPEVQKRAQEQIDRVVGFGRLPDFSDQRDLPYITAIVKETLRWIVIVPFALPHMSLADDMYKGYHIPKGTTVMANCWTILRDPEVYPEPDRFMPERFLMADGQLDPNVPSPDVIFGFGRRICAGRSLALDSMWHTAVCLLAAFNFEAKAGMPRPEGKLAPGLVIHPVPFECDIKPRSDMTVRLIGDLEAGMQV